jgi:drug/metabolite transporter (DMT)-like permease
MGGALCIVLGLVLAILGGALLSDYRHLGTLIVQKTIPHSLQTGDPDRYRQVLGYGYLLGGAAFAVVGIVVLAR